MFDQAGWVAPLFEAGIAAFMSNSIVKWVVVVVLAWNLGPWAVRRLMGLVSHGTGVAAPDDEGDRYAGGSEMLKRERGRKAYMDGWDMQLENNRREAGQRMGP